MTTSLFDAPSWITNVSHFQDTILHSTNSNFDFIDFIAPQYQDQFTSSFKQFLFWHRHFQPSITECTFMFALMGSQGLQNLEIPDLIEDMAKIGPIQHATEFYQGPNTKFLAISFPSPSDVTFFQNNFHFYKDAAVVYIPHSMSRPLNFSILWLPPLFPDHLIDSLIKKFALRFSFFKGSIRLNHGKYMRSSLVKGTCTLKHGITPKDIPHFFRLPSPHNGSALLLMDNRPHLCLKCMKEGHLRKACTAIKCSSCHSFHLPSEQCKTKSYSAVTANRPTDDTKDEWPEDLDSSHIIDDQIPHQTTTSQVNSSDNVTITSLHNLAPPKRTPTCPNTIRTPTPLLEHPPPSSNTPDSFYPQFLKHPSPALSSSNDCLSSPITSEFNEHTNIPPPPSPPLDSPQPSLLTPSTPLPILPSLIPVKIPPSKEPNPSVTSKSPSSNKLSKKSKKQKPFIRDSSIKTHPPDDSFHSSTELFSPDSPSLSIEPPTDIPDTTFSAHDPLPFFTYTRSTSSLSNKRKTTSSSTSLNLTLQEHDHTPILHKKQNLSSSATSLDNLSAT